MIASIFAAPFCGVRSVVGVQLVLLPLAHIYLVGAALVASLVCHLLQGDQGDQRGRRQFEVPHLILYPWAVWLVAASISLIVNGISSRSLFQFAEFIFYGLIGTFAFQISVGGASHLRHILKSLMASAFFLAIVLGLIYRTRGVQDGYFIGSNEAAFILVVCGLVVPVYWISTVSDWRKAAIGWVVIMVSLWAIYLGESRAGIGFGLAVIGSFVLSSLLGVSFAKCAVACAILVLLGSQQTSVQEVAGRLFDTERNFSNIERTALIESCYALFVERPWTGWGWGTMESLLDTYSLSKNSYPHPHNTYAHFAAEIGVGGLVCLGMIFIGLGTIAVGNYRAGRRHEALFAAYCLVTLVVLGMVNDYFYGANRGIIVAVMLGLAAGVQAPRKRLMRMNSGRLAPGNSLAIPTTIHSAGS
ncbi:MAG TPA: O-antigen ligase family protein [Planctomycetaceae bacterium]|nr:O-antigen ligase family protein [Planctomycetaceae bacterium]